MKRWRRVAMIMLLPLLLALAAAPAAAANGVPKTNEEHPAWLVLDPVPATTDEKQITITGRVAGDFAMTVTNGLFSTSFQTDGPFSVQVDLRGGPNQILISGDNGHGRLLNAEVHVQCTKFETPTQLMASVNGNLVANGQTYASLTAAVVDPNGIPVQTFGAPVTFASSDPSVVTVVSETVTPVGGVASTTLKAGTVAGTATVTVSTPGLPSTTVEVTAGPQVPTRLTLAADPTSLAVGGGQGTLFLELKDQTGADMLALSSPVLVRLTTDNAGSVQFAGGQSSLDVTMTTPTVQAAIFGGVAVGSATITGVGLGTALTSDTIVVNSVVVGVPYQVAIDPIPTAPAGSPQVAVLRLLDIFGNQVSDSFGSTNITVSRQNPDGSVELLGTVTVSNGRGALAFTTPAPGVYTLKAEGLWWGYPMQPGVTTYTVTP